MKKKIISALSFLEKEYRVTEIKEISTIRIYINGFIPGIVFETLLSIEGLSLVGVNVADNCILVTY